MEELKLVRLSVLSIHSAHKTSVTPLPVLAAGQKHCGLARGFHLRVLHPSNAQKAKLHLLAVFAALQNPWLFPWCKCTQRKCAANTRSGEKSSVREQR